MLIIQTIVVEMLVYEACVFACIIGRFNIVVADSTICSYLTNYMCTTAESDELYIICKFS